MTLPMHENNKVTCFLVSLALLILSLLCAMIFGGCVPCHREFERIAATPYNRETNCCLHKSWAYHDALKAAGYEDIYVRAFPVNASVSHAVVVLWDRGRWWKIDPTKRTRSVYKNGPWALSWPCQRP